MNNSFCLRATNEATMITTLSFLRYDYEGETGWNTGSHKHAFDPIGDLVDVPAVINIEGEIITPAVMVGKFHANLKCDDSFYEANKDAIDSVAIEAPTTPKVVWA
jgi:hypothetical protein